jgi:leucyl-tRNA synthetase
MMDFDSVQKKWQKRWEEQQVFKAADSSAKKKFYVLEMFPYPSGSGLHMGHAFNYIIGDIYARFKRMDGFNVLHPMGYDSLGLPAENAAIKAGTHPKEYTEKAIANFIRQQKELGMTYDWSRVVMTHDPSYYKWDQWIFLKMFERGITFKKMSPVNWCPKCNSVLANEQVHDGKCWRHEDTPVEIRHLEQWFFRITKYADELYEMIDRLDLWTPEVKAMQRNWIGKSYGTEIKFKINGEVWPIYTTRPDTVFGVTFMVVSAQHPRLMELVTKEQKREVESFLKKIKSTSEKDIEELEKEGAFTGSYAINPVNSEKVPVYAGNFVVADYGCGMVMAVPAHDQRDFEFAKKYKIPIKVVIQPSDFVLDPGKMSRAYTGEGNLVNSGGFDGSGNLDAIEDITKYLEKKGLGKKTVNYKLRDWLISRQRYWGTPIPVIYCDKCGTVPVPESELPVELPHDVKFGEGNPLATNKDFVNTKCPKCKGPARRETDTMDTFVNSSWYFLRYADANNSKAIFDPKKANYWVPVDIYIGGKEHACMHLIYFRFYTKFLRDLGLLSIDEPVLRMFNQGMVHKDGDKMSKSKGNVVLPEEISKTHGIDTARLFLISMASPDKDVEWSDEGINGSLRFVNRVVSFVQEFKPGKMSAVNESRFHRLIKEYTADLETLRYNLAAIKLKEMFVAIEQGCSKKQLETFMLTMSPICPHLAEEFWEMLGNKPFASTQKWPAADEKKIDLKAEAAAATVHSTVSDVRDILALVKIADPKKITLLVAERWLYDFMRKIKSEIEKTYNVGELIRAAMDPKHGQEISKIVPRLVKDRSKIPAVVTSQEEEIAALKEGKAVFEKEFGARVEIVAAESSKDAKAKNALPGKPAIIVE